jgi:hypothetical protein
VLPAEQHLITWLRGPGPLMQWPEAAAQAPVLPPPSVNVERDGQPLDGQRWLAGLAELDRQLVAALGRLATAWERESGVTQGRLSAEPRLMSGSAAITWGYAEQGLATAPLWRVAGQLELTACRLDLRFTGTLALQGSVSRLHLHCAAAEELKLAWERKPGDEDLAALMAPALLSFQMPFVIACEALAQPDLATLDIASPVQGQLVGACGLRPRADGTGLQWFCTLELEPLSVLMRVHDPLLGVHELVRPLLPAAKLVDWSLG